MFENINSKISLSIDNMNDKQSPVLLSFKKEPLDIMEIEPNISTNVTLVRDDIIGLNTRINHDIKEDCRPRINITNGKSNLNSFGSTKISRLRKRREHKRFVERTNHNASVPQRTFSLKWLSKPELKDWVTPVPGKPPYVSCKWCKALLRAHLHDLKKHASSKKHRKHSLLHGNVYSKEENDLDSYLHNVSSNSNTMEQNQREISQSAQAQISEDDNDGECLIPVNIGFIGCGNMAQALISGFISNGLVEPSNLLVSAPSDNNLGKLKSLGIKTTHDNKRVFEESHMIYLAVKPHIIPEVFAQLEPVENSSHNPLFVSIAAGLSITRLEAMLSHVVSVPRVIRIMPNTPCMVLQGCCVYSLGTNVQASEGRAVKCLLGSVGLCVEVPEQQMDGVCGIAGSGPAFIYAAIEAMADGGVKMGVPRNLALALAAQTVKGAATMVLETGKHPAQLKDDVCSPAGTTIAGLHALEKNGLRNALISAVEAAATRSKELG